MEIAEGIEYVGVNDHEVDLFEGQFVVPNGIAYNSYVILDEQVTIMDSVDTNFVGEWLGNVERVLAGKQPVYLVVSHMEPDHSAGIFALMEKFPECKIVATAAAFKMMTLFFGTDFGDRKVIAKEGTELQIGKRTLKFVLAPFVHWPEVMMTYDVADKILFSADAFGKFGANDVEEPWDDEARRYYIGIVGKYGDKVQALFKKLGSLEIEKICALHGPVLSENLGHYLGLYSTWSSYAPETKGVFIAYASSYGNTKRAAEFLAEKLGELGVTCEIADLARADMAGSIANAFRYDTVVLASITYNTEIFPPMKTFINGLTERNFKNRKIAIIENGSWAPTAAKVIKALLEKSEGLTYAANQVTVKSALNDETRAKIELLAKELAG